MSVSLYNKKTIDDFFSDLPMRRIHYPSTKRQNGTHTKLVDYITNRLNNSYILYNSIIVEEEFKIPVTKIAGECDVHAIYDTPNCRYLLCFEIKSSDSHKNLKKAKEQLGKDECFYSHKYAADKVFKFYVHGLPKADKAVIKRIK